MHDHSGPGAYRRKLKVVLGEQVLKLSFVDCLWAAGENLQAVVAQLRSLGTARSDVIPKHKWPTFGLRHQCNCNA